MIDKITIKPLVFSVNNLLTIAKRGELFNSIIRSSASEFKQFSMK